MAKKNKKASSALTKITTRAKQLRKAKPGMKWQTAIKQAGVDYRKGKLGRGNDSSSGAGHTQTSTKATTTGNKTSTKTITANIKVGKKRSSARQTGTSNKKSDKRRTAKPPGKRIVRHRGGKNTSYIERRKNRSDKPGQLTGVTTATLQNVVRKRLEDDLGKAMVRKKLATNYKTHKAASDKVSEISRQLKQFYN